MNINFLYILYLVISFLIGAFFGYLFVSFRLKTIKISQGIEKRLIEQELQQSQQEIAVLKTDKQDNHEELQRNEITLRNLYSELAANKEKLCQLVYWQDQCNELNQKLYMQYEINSGQKADIRELTIRLEEIRITTEEKQNLLLNNEERLATQFENLAYRIFEQNGRCVDKQNKQSLDLLLSPLREQLESFRRQVQDSFGHEARERHTLTHEIHSLQQLNEKMARDAINLTNALKGSNKLQGNWGEMILSKILESSGLREGHEYQTQFNIKVDLNNRMQPDVIIRLPHGKDVIIDAKTALVAYERYFNSEDIVDRNIALDEHISSLRNHIKNLSKKSYHQLPGLRSLDYILMFIPIEPAFLIAIDRQPELINEALHNNIMLVSPTSLLVALRTINNLWRYEHQSQNSQLIAERAAKLYDKLRLFIDDMELLGQNLDKTRINYHQAMNKLVEGRGNVIKQVETFRTLGVTIKKPISKKIVEKAGVENENIEKNDCFLF